jgi:hypothetical protein
MGTRVLKNKPFILLAMCLLYSTTSFGCNKTKNEGKKSNMDAIIEGTFATDRAMEEERIEQGNYIKEQEQRYE